MSKVKSTLTNGIIRENPAFRLILGMCPLLAVTTAAFNGIGMGLASTFVLISSNILISLLRNVISPKVRIPSYIVIIASFTTFVQMLTQAFLPDLYSALGIYLSLIVVNCLIMGRAEAFASKNPVGLAALDGLSMGLGFTLALFIMGGIREIIGNGTIFGIQFLGESFEPMALAIMPPGGFLIFGLLIALINKFQKVSENIKNREKSPTDLEPNPALPSGSHHGLSGGSRS